MQNSELTYESDLKGIIIENIEDLNCTPVRCNGNRRYFGAFLEKLTSNLNKLNYNDYALTLEDKIFKYISKEILKGKFNKI